MVLPKTPGPAAAVTPRQALKVGRNEPCPCGSGKKYKQCHFAEGEAFLQKLAYEKEKMEHREMLRKEGVPWYKRLISRLSEDSL